jgi:2-phospho-L-lactate guanylyltransferase
VVLAPDRDQLGTNALLTRPPEAMPLCFGEHSFPRHLEAARLARLEVAVYESRGTRADVDLPSQWEELAWKPV